MRRTQGHGDGTPDSLLLPDYRSGRCKGPVCLFYPSRCGTRRTPETSGHLSADCSAASVVRLTTARRASGGRGCYFDLGTSLTTKIILTEQRFPMDQ